jgi:hypothetical protein
MRKIIIAAFATAALCTSVQAPAAHLGIDPALLDMMFETQEDCDEALAMERQMNRAEQDYAPGRERGQFNKDFNARYDCEYDEMSMSYMVVDNA